MPVSLAEARSERERIARSRPLLAACVEVVPLEGAEGYALRVHAPSSWRIVHVGDGEHESGSVFPPRAHRAD